MKTFCPENPTRIESVLLSLMYEESSPSRYDALISALLTDPYSEADGMECRRLEL